VLGVLAVAGAAVVLASGGGPKGAGVLTTNAPWPANNEGSLQRAGAIGLPAAGTALHIHVHLGVIIEGHGYAIPDQIGLSSGGIASLHTHDQTGVLHVESAETRTFTLGQFFQVWGVRFTPRCIGGYCTDATRRLRVYVNGKPASGDPRSVTLAAHQEILVTYGTRAQVPNPVPTTYKFPPGK
jgi:hypothetical protein